MKIKLYAIIYDKVSEPNLYPELIIHYKFIKFYAIYTFPLQQNEFLPLHV